MMLRSLVAQGTLHHVRLRKLGLKASNTCSIRYLPVSLNSTTRLPELGPEKSALPPKIKPSLLQRVKEGALHYWHGSKLLVLETRISFGILRKVLRGEKLIRREYRQLLRTSSDLVRLIPFIIIAIVPFLEFALPVLLKFFPNMLPSTFEDKFQAEEKVKKQLKIKLETAKFLQDMAESVAQNDPKVQELNTLFRRARNDGALLTAQEIAGASKSVLDSVKLETLGRAELFSLCRFMGLSSFGTDAYLRFQIRSATNKLKADDRLIAQEGVSSLTSAELRSACHVRGIRTVNTSEEFMRSELQQWIDLQLQHSIPAPLLILSRALTLSYNLPINEGLQEAIETIKRPRQDITPSLEELPSEQKIELLREQQKLIESELESRKQLPKDEKLSHVETISEAIVTLSSPTPTTMEREDLAELKEEVSGLKGAATSNPRVGAIELQVDKLIQGIEKQISDFEVEIGKRLHLVTPAKDGTISVEQLQSILRHLRSSPQDSEKLREIIRAFDKDGDGKIFIRDILELAGREASDSRKSI